jgi:hypothetical protein
MGLGGLWSAPLCVLAKTDQATITYYLNIILNYKYKLILGLNLVLVLTPRLEAYSLDNFI